MKTILVVLGGLLFAQQSDIPTDAIRADSPTDTAPLAESDEQGQLGEQPQALQFEPIAPERIPGADGETPLEPLTPQAPLVPVGRLAGGPPPREILDRVLTWPEAEALDGLPITLVDVLAPTRSRAQQTQLIGAYWDLSAAVANYHIALDERSQLEKITTKITAPMIQVAESDRALVEIALAEADVDVYESRLAAVEAQHRLAALRPIVIGDALPLPADAPHVGAYQTRFEAIFAGRPAPQARQLNDTLPIQHATIRARAHAADRIAGLVSLRLASFEAGGVDVSELLALRERLHQQRLRFIAAVRQYNLRIAQYASNVAPDGTDGARLVVMLIPESIDRAANPGPTPAEGLRSVLVRPPTTGSPSSDGSSSGVVQASAEEPIEPAPGADTAESSEVDKRPKDGFVPRREPTEP